METISDFVEAFSRQQDQYKKIEKEVETLCRTLLDGNIKFSWQSRVKEAGSLRKKLEERRHNYHNDTDNINDIKDLVAGRVILTRWKDFPLVEKAIEENFHVKNRSQHPKSGQDTLLQRFRGYDGLHLYVTLSVFEHGPYSNLLIEIQVQSAFMWAFSTLEHDIIYKQLHGHPDPNLVLNLEILKGIANLGEVALEQYDELLCSDSQSPLCRGPEAKLDLPILITQFAQDRKDTISRKLQEQKQNKRIISWVSNAHFERDHNRVRTTLGSTYHDSGQRFRPIYDAWILSPERPVFWLSGAVGTGKSSLLSRVIEWHFTTIQSRKKERLAFFYCSRKAGKRASPLEVLRSLIAQLATSLDHSSISRVIAKEYMEHPLRPIEIQECPQLLEQLVNEYQKTTIIIDALDECEDANVLLLRLRELNNHTAGARMSVKFFFSSRKQVAVDQFFQQCEKLEIGSGTDLLLEDMKNFIQIQVKEREKLCLGSRLLQGRYPELENELVQVLIDQSQGMFMWVKLQLEFFLGPQSRMRHPKDVEKKLELLKMGNETQKAAKLHQVYDEIYDSNTEKGSHSRAIADRAFKWMICAQRALYTTELVEAASIDDDGTEDKSQMEDLLRICSNFVTSDELEFVRFPHVSAREYLQQRFEKKKGSSQDQRHMSIAKICLISLLHHDRGVKNFKKLQRNILGYSVVYWATHLAKVASCKRPESLERLYKKFVFGNDRNFLIMPHERPRSLQCLNGDFSNNDVKPLCMSWLEILPKVQDQVGRIDLDQKFRLQNCISEPANTLYAACVFGFIDMIPKCLSTADADKPNPEGSSPLWLASKYAHYEVSTFLLEKGAEVDAEDRGGRTALLEASINGDERIVLSLLEKNATVNRWFGDCGTALYKALEGEHYKVARLLLQYGAQTSVRGKIRQTALLKASEEGHENVVHFLLQENADVDAQDRRGYTSLTAASEMGHESIVQLLLQCGADVNPHYSHGPSALYVASRKGHEKIVTVLLDKNADVHAEGGYDHTPLLAASAKGHEKTVALLLDKNADVNAHGGFYDHTPLLAASIEGHEVTVQMLLQKPNIDIKVRDQGHIALYYALEIGHANIARLLLEKGVISRREALLNATLTSASGNRFMGAVQPLLEKVAESSQGELGQILIRAGLDRDRKKLMQTLLDMGADVNTEGDCGEGFYGTVLQRASYAGDKKLVQLLLECPNININAQRRSGTALHLASENGHDAVVQLLLNREDIAINARYGKYSPTSLFLASSAGFEKIVQLLLDHSSIDANASGVFGTALHASLKNRWAGISQLLLGHKNIDVNIRGFGYTPLQIAEELADEPGYKQLQQLLLEKGASPNFVRALSDEDHWRIT